jgi:hypothetical protein
MCQVPALHNPVSDSELHAARSAAEDGSRGRSRGGSDPLVRADARACPRGRSRPGRHVTGEHVDASDRE